MSSSSDLNYDPCPPACHGGSHVSGLVFVDGVQHLLPVYSSTIFRRGYCFNNHGRQRLNGSGGGSGGQRMCKWGADCNDNKFRTCPFFHPPNQSFDVDGGKKECEDGYV